MKRRGRQQPRRLNKLIPLLVLCGTALLANNAILIVRMLVDNFRSFAEVKPHILLNYPLAAIAACLAVALAVGRKKSTASPGQRAFSLATVLMLAALIALLYNWQFFVVLA